MLNTKNISSQTPLLIDGLTIMERLRALGDFRQRIKGVVNIPVDQVREHLLSGSPPMYYDTIRLIDVTGGAETTIATIYTATNGSAPDAVDQLPAGARITGWASIGEKPIAEPRTFQLFVVIGRAYAR